VKTDGAWLFSERLLYVDWVDERALSWNGRRWRDWNGRWTCPPQI